ncbi:MAG: hypothetical protein FWG11_08235, partial [Promicromonosporaceae bacterium]|nr:hypothetical protein [Promicromonosporaceae bacterium]
MYDGYWTYDGVEIINVARLMAYRDNGVTPPGVKIEDCTSVCDGLSEALGHGPYRTPLLDAPPWFSVNDPASADFAGVLPLEITGTDGSVRTVQMNDAVMGGARPSRPQYGARTIGVTALLLGRTTAGVQAGLTWLTSALHQGCAGGDCGGARLTGLTVCPDIVSGQVDPTSPQIVKNAYTDIAQFTTSGIHAPIGPETGRNWAVNPSAEYGLAGISVPSYLDATGTPTNLPPGALATVPTTDSNASGSAVFQLTTPPSPAAGPLYEWHYLTPAIDTSADPTDPDVEGNPWIVRWVDSGINAVAQWRVEDDEDRVVNVLFNEDPAIGWEAGPALAALTQGPIPGGLGPSEGSGYAVLTVGDASTPTEPDGGATTVLLRQYVPLPAGMAEPTGVPQTEPRFWVDASAIVSGTDGTPVTVRVSQVEGIGGETAEFTAASTHWSYVPVSSAETGFTIANGGVWVTVEVDVDTPTGTVVQVDRLSLRLVYMNVTSVPEAGAPLAERVSAYVQPPGVPVRLSALVGTDETGATTATYQWDGVLWRPGEITTPAQFLLGDAGTFEADPGWAQAWRAESNSSLPIRSNVHAMGSSGEDIGSQGWSLLAQQGSGTGVRYGVVDLVDYVNGPGTYTARGYAFVPTSAALNQGLSVLLNGTQIAVALTATKTAWTPLTFTFTIPDATVISTLTMHATSTAASTANMMWLDNIEI